MKEKAISRIGPGLNYSQKAVILFSLLQKLYGEKNKPIFLGKIPQELVLPVLIQIVRLLHEREKKEKTIVIEKLSDLTPDERKKSAQSGKKKLEKHILAAKTLSTIVGEVDEDAVNRALLRIYKFFKGK